MKKTIVFYILMMVCGLNAVAAGLRFEGPGVRSVAVKAETSTGLETIYVVDNLSASRVIYTGSQGGSTPKWQQYSNLGGGYAEDVAFTSLGNGEFAVNAPSSDMGYIIEEDGSRHCYWVVDYSKHAFELQTVTAENRDDCSRVFLSATGNVGPITCYSINGRAFSLSREIEVRYSNLKYDEESHFWNRIEENHTIPYFDTSTNIEAPFCDTEFTVSGDRFLREWGREMTFETPTYRTIAVSAETTSEQVAHDYDNEQKDDASSLGGSAPAEITFSAYPTDAAVFKEWQISDTQDFDVITDRYSQDEFTYVFNDEGTFYVRYQCGDADGHCMFDSETYTVSIGASKLEIPNAFSPGNQDGINDIWKVSYTSLISFECHIFNRWGQKMIDLTHPSQGWDGRYKGKLVPNGVYFYVIKAVGADGRKYNESGDINIINSRVRSSGSGDSDSGSGTE